MFEPGRGRQGGSDGGDETWFDAPSAGDADATSPVWLLLAGGGIGLIASVVALGGGIALEILGYLMASVVLFTLVALFRRLSIERAARLGIGTSRGLNVAALILLGAGFVVALIHAWNIAKYYS